MPPKDIVSKDILKRIAVDIAQVLLHLEVDQAEIIETDYQRVEDRHADLVALMSGRAGQFILHIEIQNDNQAQMPWRMLRYRVDIGHTRPQHDVRQYLIYIGKAPLSMADRLVQSGLDYRYDIIDMHTVDCRALIEQDNPDALVLAILCDFKGRPEREVVHYILKRLRELTADSESRFRDYMRMLEILSTNRSLDKLIEEEQKMLSQVDQTRLPSFRVGMEQGMQQGMQQGIQQGVERGLQQGQEKVLEKLLTLRFGPLTEATRQRLQNADIQQLDRWVDNILTATSLEDLLNG